MHIYACAYWAVVIYRQWFYIVLEHSRSPSPHKIISHHVDCEHCVSGLLIV